ncbi:MAG: DUF934 domain-containing protein [Alphaproteobacteria bacterium]|nr:DUF934 domain-containing protein [Alphaproteobacteria bacterium]
MPLIKGGNTVVDQWRYVDDADDIIPHGPVIVSLTRWREQKESLRARSGPLGIRLAADEPPVEIADELDRFDLVALEFPVFRDGRAYSYARLLRERLGFDGELRAVGNVLRDQFLFLHRCGFDAFEVADDRHAGAWLQSISEFSVWYQPATDSRTPVLALRQAHQAAAE